MSLLAAFCAVAISLGAHARQTTVTPKPHFVPLRPALATSSVQLTFGLPATNMEGLHAALYDVSDPKSANYGKHLSKAEVEAFVAPKADSVKAVNDWLSQHGIHPEVISPSGDMLRIDVPVSKANSLLGANFTEFKDQQSGTTLVRTLSVTIPDDVDSHIQFLYPTTQFILPVTQNPRFQVVSPPKTSAKRQGLPSICSVDVDPECLEDFYHIPTAAANASSNSLAVSGYLGEFASEDDLETFFLAFRPDVTTTPEFSVVSVDSGVTTGNGTLEASLDIQYTVGIATGVPTTFYSVGNPFAEGFIDLANFLLGLDELPLVLTTSYGFNENDFIGSEALAESFCNVYAQLGARGTSVFFCSGDNGVYSFSFNSLCDATEFGPTFPSTCPFLTSVGGTQGFSPEVAAPFSGGGFSNMFARPDYQDTAVESYLTRLGGEFAGLFNQSGRAFPDVSAQSVDFITRISGVFELVEGTSASTPLFASVVALLNDALLTAGKPTLGFINPLLYSEGSSALNDITSGSNPGCGAQGFPTMEGWDPVTGLGTPDYEKLLALVTGLGA
ncbi:family S53 protease [Trametes coccinea BRFM310]|uniref:tripeptidyl-peptidase II n=1 Tax=Trametes coccinea (strain BRFM310) TaxID=1353009 RepID=A0A1Y2J2I0_TRAC3|nr:family S53 protease [Trametes coccinea BRFM310]